MSDTPLTRSNMLRLRNGFTVRPDGSEEPTYGYYVTEDCYRTLERELAAARQRIEGLEEWLEAIKNESIGRREKLEAAESRLAAVEAERDAIRLDAERYRWLLDDHDGAEVRDRRRSICENIAVKTYSSVSRDIDLAIRKLKEKS